MEIISEMPKVFEGRAELLESLIGQVKALGKVQKENGMFCTVLDEHSPVSSYFVWTGSGTADAVSINLRNIRESEQKS